LSLLRVADEFLGRPQEVLSWLLSEGILVTRAQNQTAGEWIDFGWRHALHLHYWSSDQDYLETGEEWGDGNQLAEYLRKMLPTRDEPPLPVDFASNDSGGDVAPIRAGVSKTLIDRRTCRNFRRRLLSNEILAQILNEALAPLADNAARHRRAQSQHDYRLLVGSSYVGMQVYLSIQRVDGIEPGIYSFSGDDASIHILKSGDFSLEMRRAANGQFVHNASAVLILACDLNAVAWRYQTSRAIRKVYIETGALAQRVLIAATALDVQSFVTPATQDSLLAEILGMGDATQQPLYLIGLG